MLKQRRVDRRSARTMIVTVPAPVGGLNSRDSLDLMPATDAVKLENWNPGIGALAVRDGYQPLATDITSSPVETICEYHAGVTRKLLVSTGGGIYEATGTPTLLASGFSGNRWQSIGFNGQMGLVNGTDAPQLFDGASVSAMTISGSGLTASKLMGVMTHHSRSYFFEKDSQDFWYSAINALGGTLTRFPLSRVGQFGGNLVCMGSWNVEGGSNVWGGGGVGEDMAVFCMSSGDIIVYRGDDPGSNWALVGVFRAGVPVDVRGIARRGSDLLVLTSEGLVSIARLVSEGSLSPNGVVSDKIRPTLVEAVRQYGANAGWQVLVHSRSGQTIVNVPLGGGAFEQYVMNTLTGAWTRWTGIASTVWGLFEDIAYHGAASGTVNKMTGETDAGAPIAGDVQTAYNTFGQRGLLKRCVCLRPIFRGKASASIGLTTSADFRGANTTPVATDFGPSGDGWANIDSTWETWDDHVWEGSQATSFSEWRAADGLGYTLGARLTSSTTDLLEWETLTYQLEMGQGLI